MDTLMARAATKDPSQMATLVYSLERDANAPGDDTRSVATDAILSFANALIGYRNASYRELTNADDPFPAISVSVSEGGFPDSLAERIAEELRIRGLRIKSVSER